MTNTPTTLTCDRSSERRRLTGDAGYVLALGGLLLVPLMIAVGFSVDIGSWYARSTQIQKAADAAALAGAAWLPDHDDAEAAAREVLAKNGFPDSNSDGTVDGTDTRIVYQYPDSQKFQVRLVDLDVQTFFSGVVLDKMEIRRQAIAEFILPVAMGSPRNFLGTGSNPDPAGPEGSPLPAGLTEWLWLAASGPCASREQGDYLGTISDGNNLGTGWQCEGGAVEDVTGESYRDGGYYYAVEVPEEADGDPLYVDVYDASNCAGSVSEGTPYGEQHTTHIRFLNRDANPYDPTDNPVLADPVPGGFITADTGGQCSDVSGINSGGWRNGWRRLAYVASAPAGIYFIQVETEKYETNNLQNGSNSFGLRASPDSSWSSAAASLGGSVCSSDPTDVTYYTSDCLGVYGIDWMGVFANTGGSRALYLAEIGDEHSGKDLIVTLWDPGEGADAIEILDPLGHSVSFGWEVQNLSSDATPTGGWSGSVNQAGGVPCTLPAGSCASLSVCCTGSTQPGPNRQSTWKYNDRLVELTISLPEDIATEYTGATWWKVRYTTGGAATDRTTWSVTVEGDPVRLVE